MSKPEFTDMMDEYQDEREDGKYKMETLRKELNALVYGNHNEQPEN